MPDLFDKPERHPLAGTPLPLKLGVVLFLLLFIAFGIAFSVMSAGAGAPIIFAIGGIGLAILGGLMLFTALTRGFKGSPRIDPDSPIRTSDTPPRTQRIAAKCPGCGARRISDARFCAYCGSALS